VPENVSIAYRGANYAIGQGPGFYGIWPAAVPQPQPLESWPLTPAGWAAAWTRFASIEEPFTITPVMAPVSAPAPAATAGPATAGPATAGPAAAATVTAQAPAMAQPAPAPAGIAPAGTAPAGTAPAETAAAGSADAGPGTALPGAAAAGPAGAPGAFAAAPGLTAPGEAGPAPSQPFPGMRPGDGIDPVYNIDPSYGQVEPRPARGARPAGPAGPAGPADPVRANRLSRIAAGLLGLGVVLGVIGIFPSYNDGASLASQSSSLIPHIFYLVAWAAGAVLILFAGLRRQAGALLALSLSVVTLGFFITDIGTPIADGASLFGAGLVLSLLSWVACTAGAGLAFSASGLSLRTWPGFRFGRGTLSGPHGHEIVPTITLIAASIGAVVAFAPSWDRYTLDAATTGVTRTITEGNAFANPGAIITGNVAVMLLVVVVMVVAALWLPRRLGAAVAAGAIVPLVAEVVSAMVQISQGLTPAQAGFSSAEASELGLTISSGLTPMFWVFCAFTATMVLLSVWLLLTPEPPATQRSPYVANGLTLG